MRTTMTKIDIALSAQTNHDKLKVVDSGVHAGTLNTIKMKYKSRTYLKQWIKI